MNETSSMYVLILMVITLIVVVIGVVLMARGGKLNKLYSNKLMSMRVIFQALTIALVFLLWYFKSK